MLRLISHNTNNITTCDIICTVWDSWMEKRKAAGNGKAVKGADMDDDDDDIPEKRPLDDGEA